MKSITSLETVSTASRKELNDAKTFNDDKEVVDNSNKNKLPQSTSYAMIRLYANNKHTDIIETKKIKNFDRNKSKFPYDAFVHTGYDENSVKIFEPAAILAISDDYDTLSKPVKRWTKPNKRNFEKKESVQEAEKSMGQKVDLLNFENLYSEKVDEKDIMIAALQKQFRDMEKKLQSNEKSEVEKMESNNDTFNDRSHQQMLPISKNKQQFAGGIIIFSLI
uniref:Uncharacterized protein n=1 Tax=Trichogramma kaykai TaxID=54128 RepID=A0ABD2WZK4_9HYME